MPVIDLSHTIEHGMTTYPGLPAPLICDYLSREASRTRYAEGVIANEALFQFLFSIGAHGAHVF